MKPEKTKKETGVKIQKADNCHKSCGGIVGVENVNEKRRERRKPSDY